MDAKSDAVSMLPNGAGGAAIVAAGVGAFALGILSVAADKYRPLAKVLIFYRPTGPLSGVSTLAILAWLVVWALLHYSWRARNVNLRRAVTISFALLTAGILLTFPPFADLL